MKHVYHIALCSFVYILFNNSVYAADDVVNYSCAQQENEVTYCLDSKGKPLSGKVEQIRDDGTPQSIENYSKGYLNGLVTYFDADGKQQERLYYNNGIKNGMYKKYYPNRTIQILANYKKGLLDGRVDLYSDAGKLKGRMYYKNGYLERGYCESNGQKQNFSAQKITEQQFNTLVQCGDL